MNIQTAAAMVRPAISIAAEAGDLDALRRELTRGVAVDLEDPSGNTALQIVCRTHNADVSLEDRIACVKMLLEHGAAPNAGLPNHPGHRTVEDVTEIFTPLMLAICRRRRPKKVVEILIAAGSDVNGYIPDSLAQMGHLSPLFLAVGKSFGCPPRHENPHGLDVVKLLLKAGADPNPPERWGRTVMEDAIRFGARRTWPVLLRAGAVLPTRVTPYQGREYGTNRADPYLLRVESAGGFQAHEKVHREKLLAIFAPKLDHLVPPELVSLIVEYAFHLGFY